MKNSLWASLAAAFVAGAAAEAGAQVDPAGAFNHTIEIRLPEAVGGVQPELAVSYNSRAGDGLLGVGWELEGFPVITRMHHGAGINYNGGDTYAGPDGRLINFNGTHVYRTEEESWGKYVPYRCSGAVWTGAEGDGGPCSWKLTQADGDVLEFGGSEDSRIQAVDRGGAIRVWALSKYTDTAGNFYTVSYYEATAGGVYAPTAVTYNQGNGRSQLYRVDLGYELRNDRVSEYAQSALVQLDRRLKWLTVSGSGQQIRKYRFDYEEAPGTRASRLVTVQEHGRDNSTLPAQTFSYQGAGSNLLSMARWATGQGGWLSTDTTAGTSQWFGGDFNGDGKADVAKAWSARLTGEGDGMNADVHLSSGATFTMQRWATRQGGWINTNTSAGSWQWFSGDFNGDGRTDLAKIWNDMTAPGNAMSADVHVSNGSGFVLGRWATRQGGWISTDANAGNSQWFSGDFNGDGKADLAKVWNDGGHISADVHVSSGTSFAMSRWATQQGLWINTNSSAGQWQWFSGDFNGDGKTDLAKIWNSAGMMAADVHVSTGSGFRIERWANPQGGWISTNTAEGNSQWFTGDFNGDGKTDLAKAWNDGGYVSADTHLSTGKDFSLQRWATRQDGWISTNAAAGQSDWMAEDMDGDGRTDLVKIWNYGGGGRTTVDVHRSAGVSFELQRVESGVVGWVPTNTAEGRATWMSADYDGSGTGDLALIWNDMGHATFDAHLMNQGQPTRDLLNVAANGMGAVTTLTYQRATQVANAIRPDLTTCGSASGTLCGNASPAPIPLVTRVTVADGRDHTYSTSYSYFNGRYFPGTPDQAEHLGFQQTTVLDEQLNTWESTTYRQDKPYQGRPSRIERFASGDLRLSSTNLYYATLASSVATRLIRSNREESAHYDLGVLKYTTETRYAYDVYGNVTLESNLNDTTSAADNVYESTAYINDTTQWRIGLVRSTRTCADAACSSVLQYKLSYYDGLANGLVGSRSELTRSSQWRSDTSSYLNTSYAYDASGNLLTRTNPAGVVDVRYDYDASSGAVQRTTDASGNTVVNEYDPVTGELIASTNPNGATATFRYDAFGRRDRAEAPHDGATRSVVEESWSYNPNLHVLTTHTDSGAIVTTDTLDGLGRVWKSAQTWDNGGQLETDTFFDAAGREYKTCAAHLALRPVDPASCTTKHFDAAGRVVRIDSPRSGGGFATTTTAYDGYRTTVTDPKGHVVATQYDPGTLTTVLTQPGSLATLTQKDLLGRVVRVTDPAGNAATYRYNSLGWKLAQTDPVVGDSTFGYDALGRLTAQTDAAGETVGLYYDNAGRLVRTDYAPLSSTGAGAEDTVMKYDFLSAAGDIANGKGKLVRIQDRSGTALFAYDAAGRIRTATKTIDGVPYVTTTTYSRTGKRAGIAYPDGSVVRYQYDTAAEHLSGITLNNVEVMRYANYNERGAPTSVTYGNDLNAISLTFESTTGELLQQQDRRDFVNNYYAYDERGMLIEERDLRAAKPNGDTSKAFAYDPLGQLVGAAMGGNATCGGVACSGSAWSKSYRYDGTGRVLEKDGKTFSYDVTRRFQLLRVDGEAADRTYDAVGRLLSKSSATGASDSYVNGSDGFLRQHSRDGVTLHRMTYDYQGNRVKKEYLGANPQTTWDLGAYKIVHDRTSGKYYHTLYVMGLHGSRVAHRTVEKSGMVAAAAWGAYHDRALASMYEPGSLAGFLPWVKHQGTATFKSVLNDLDGAGGVVAALAALAMLLCVLTLAVVSLLQILSVALARLRSGARAKRRTAWLAPAMLCVATAACVGNYDSEPQEQATADSIGKEGRYGIIQALGRGGTNQPVPGTFYYLNSPLGSTSVMFDAQGAALLRLEYFPDGAVNSAASVGDYIATHTFGQKEYDKELEAYYNAFRYYDAATMRFTTPDAIKDSSDFLVHNIYAYTRNNPVSFVDPTGLATMRHDGGGQRARVVVRPPVYVPPKRTYVPVKRPANPTRTARFNRGADGAAVIPARSSVRTPAERPAAGRPAGVTRTGAFAGGPDGAGHVPARHEPRRMLPAESMRIDGENGPIGAPRMPPSVNLYRAVGEDEFNELMQTGLFKAGRNSLGGKFFAESPTHADRWGTILEGADNFRIVEVQLPRSVADTLQRWKMLDGIGPARYAEVEVLNAVNPVILEVVRTEPDSVLDDVIGGSMDIDGGFRRGGGPGGPPPGNVAGGMFRNR